MHKCSNPKDCLYNLSVLDELVLDAALTNHPCKDALIAQDQVMSAWLRRIAIAYSEGVDKPRVEAIILTLLRHGFHMPYNYWYMFPEWLSIDRLTTLWPFLTLESVHSLATHATIYSDWNLLHWLFTEKRLECSWHDVYRWISNLDSNLGERGQNLLKLIQFQVNQYIESSNPEIRNYEHGYYVLAVVGAINANRQQDLALMLKAKISITQEDLQFLPVSTMQRLRNLLIKS